MKKLNRIGFALLLVVSLFSCREDNKNTNMVDQTPIDPPRYEVNASVFGIVVDTDGNPISDAQISIEGHTLTSDDNGVFSLKNETLNQYGTLIKVEKAGYFKGLRFVEPGLNRTAQARIQMTERSLSGSFDAGAPGTVSISDASVDFQNSSFVDANGNSYSGVVNVYANLYAAGMDETLLNMPGDLRAISDDNELVQLATFGMVGVELESASGAALQLADGTRATINIPISSDQLANAPSEIPLWYMDEETGYWLEEGVAVKEGNMYTGEVNHFSFWNCDYPYPLVQLTGNVQTDSGNPIEGVYVTAELQSTGAVGYASVDDEGSFSGKVPKGAPMILRVHSPCGDVIHEMPTGPFNDDTNLPTITIDPGVVNIVTLTGNLVNCDMNEVVDGYIVISGDHYSVFAAEEDGSFEYSSSFCTNSVDLQAFDKVALKESLKSSHDLSGGPELALGQIDVCDELTEYINLDIDGVNVFIFDPTGLYNSSQGVFEIGGSSADSTSVWISVESNGLDTNNPSYAYVEAYDENWNLLYAACQGDCDNFTISVGDLGNVGDLVEGSFTGTIYDPQTGVDREITGDYRVLREE